MSLTPHQLLSPPQVIINNPYFPQMGKKQLKDPKEAADIATAEMLRRTHHSRAWYRVIAGRANKGGSKVPFYNKPKVRGRELGSY